MPTDPDSTLRNTIEAIRAAYVAALPGRLHDMSQALQQCLEAPDQLAHVERLQLYLHSIAGSAGTFNLAELGARATALEMRINQAMASGALSGDVFAPIATDIAELVDWAQNMPHDDADDAGRRRLAEQLEQLDQTDALPHRAGNQVIYLVHDNALVAEDIAAQLRYFGYDVTTIPDLAQMQRAIAQRMPAAVVMDLGFPTAIMAGATEVARIRAAYGNRFAVIFLSTRSNFEARLATVRAGADGYFSKPLDMVALIDRLDALLIRDDEHPYRILIVDDDVQTAGYYAAVLRGAGMDVNVLQKVSDLLDVLGEYRPELILMDVYMPGCDGVDLARLIRQDNMYLDVPIVFLSRELHVEKQLRAIESGADDFLTKPIEPAHLVSALTSRAKRYRALRGLIMRDGLTGLYNHSAIKEHLLREVARARRSATPLALAMIDIDFFKRVNDSYGHPVGDQVIRALSRLLLQRLRRGDMIGRYGGEEFAVILPGTTAATAAKVLDQIRESFSNIRHHAEAHDFSVTFSGGIMEMTAESDVDQLFAGADAALYRAKHNGRNRIDIA